MATVHRRSSSYGGYKTRLTGPLRIFSHFPHGEVCLKGPIGRTILYRSLPGRERIHLEKALARYGYTILPVEGKALVRGARAPVADLLILDLENVSGGPKTVRDLRSRPNLGRIPLLILVPPRKIKLLPAFLEAGADDYLLKPVDSRLLYNRLENLLGPNPRAHHRIPCEMELDLLTSAGPLPGEMRELGEGGMSALLPRKLASGEVAKAFFFLPRQQDPIEAGVMAVYAHPHDSGHLTGLKFILLEEAARKRIRHFISRPVRGGAGRRKTRTGGFIPRK